MGFRKKEYLIIFIIALVLRIGLLGFLYSTPTFFNPDYVTDQWDQISQNILDGNGFSWVKGGDFPTICRGPIYPLFLVILKVAGNDNLLIMRILYLILDSILVLLIMKFCFDATRSKTAAWFSGVFYAIFLIPAWHVAKFSPDVFFSFVLLMTAFLFLKFVRSGSGEDSSLPLAVASGLAFGVAILAKKTVLFLPPIWIFIGLYAKRFKKSAIIAYCAWILAAVAALSPWLHRNYKLTGSVTTIQTATWMGYWLGEFIDANPYSHDLVKFQEWASATVGDWDKNNYYPSYHLSPEEDLYRENKLRVLAIEHLKANVWHQAAKTGRNLFRFWYLTDTGRMTRYTKPLSALIFILMVLGAGTLIAKRKMSYEAVLALGTIIYFNLLYSPILALLRYMIPVLPFISLFVGVGAAVLYERLKKNSGASV